MKNLAFRARGKKEKLHTNILTDEQINKIKNDFPKDLKLYALFSLSSGMDVLYLCNIKWDNIDFDRRIATID